MEIPATTCPYPTSSTEDSHGSDPNSINELNDKEHVSTKHAEEVYTDLSQELKNKKTCYILRDWVQSKLEQIKDTSSLSVNTSVLPNSVKIDGHILSLTVQMSSNKTANMELHFFEDGIIKFNCINPSNPSQFSFELIERPANLTPYALEGKAILELDHAKITLYEVQTRVEVRFSPFTVTLFSTRDDANEVLFQMNGKNSLHFDDNLAADFSFSTEYLYGLPEKATNLLLEDTKAELPYRFYNQGVPIYPINSKDSIYGAVPVVVSRKKDSSTMVSMYWQNTSDTYVDIHRNGQSTNTYWLSERGNLECYVFVSHDTATHFRSTANVFGHCAMPQYFSLGYHQCRWSYEDQTDVLEVNAKFNEHEIPCDSITLDIDYTDGCRYFTWNEKLFPDPRGLQETLMNDKRQLITIADPHIKVDEEYHIYKEIMEKDLVVKNKDNEVFVGDCWPGDSVYIDFMNEEARECWASQYGYDKYKNSTKNVWAWNDMNEPIVYGRQGNHMPVENIHTCKSLAEPEKAFQVEHREVHNIYGYCQHKATYDGMLKRDSSQSLRPHVLTRSFFAGSQKWTVVWTGDTGATWGYLKVTIPQLLSLSLCGISNCGGDVGGFAGDPEPELAVRWYQLGTFMPYFRGHSEKACKRREPWLYEAKYSNLIKESIKERYRLLPYWYTCFEEHCRTAVPILRPIWFSQETIMNEEVMQEQERFMVGEGLLIVPIVEPGQTALKRVTNGLKGRWYDYNTKKEVLEDDEIETGLERIGCFIHGGHIIPTFELDEKIKSSQDAKESDISLYVAVDGQEQAKGKFYMDDGETFDYQKGSFIRKNIAFDNNILTWSCEDNGEFDIKNNITKVIVLGVKTPYKAAYLVEESQPKLEAKLTMTTEFCLIEFEAAADKNWKILLE